MTYDDIANKLVDKEVGVEHSTLMKGPCLRYKGDFMAAMFEPENAMIIKVSPKRVNELIASGEGKEFNFTKKRFKEWVLIPASLEKHYEKYLHEALAYAKRKK
ncbi:hypothetical protein [Sedimenticola sp.]|uniref:hypothetical protein n=1 Tax=Sedimenticola sp. TaxID=1940285 RepID=UPI003D1123EB